MKKALIMCMSDPSKDPRPNRIIKLLKNHGYIVDTYAYKNHGEKVADTEYIIKYKKNTQTYTKFRQYLRTIVPLKYKTILTYQIHNIKASDIEKFDYDLIVVEDIELLPLAIKNKNGAKILCDLREFYPKQFENSLRFRLLISRYKKALCNRYLKECDVLITVSEGLQRGYKEDFGVETELIRSIPYYVDIKPSDIDNNKIKMVHHGSANQARKLENMINMFEWLDNRFTLDFYLVGSQDYINDLKELASKYPQIRFQSPVPLNDIVNTMNKYDIGLYFLEPTGFNTEFSLPNKFFEYIQARLAIAIGPSYDMKLLLDEYDLGVVSDSFDIKNLAYKLNNLSKEGIKQYKENVNKAAKELCYEQESEKTMRIINEIL